jgi:hypothetical protein
VKKVPVHLRASLRNCPLTLHQHYKAKHNFECSECDDEFTTEAARDEVRPFLCFWLLDQVLIWIFSTTRKSTARWSAPSVTANSKLRRRWIRFTISPLFGIHLLTNIQHRRAKHRVECSECDREFDSEESMNKIRPTAWSRDWLSLTIA